MKAILVIIFIIGIVKTQAVQPKKYYVFKNARLNWYLAGVDCITRNLQLATINSAEEQSALEKAITDAAGEKEDFWLSGADLGEEGSFLWMSTGRALSYTNWLQGQPDNYAGVEHCMHIWNTKAFGIWNDSSCFSKIFYVCEDKADFD